MKMDQDRLSQLLQSKGIKPTAMRMLVYHELERARHPLSLKEMEERMVTAERSTIFRALTLLHEHHVVHAIEDGSGQTKYELCHAHDLEHQDDDLHPHFHCVHCQRTYCLHDIPLPQIVLPQGFTFMAANHLITGLCPQCAVKTGHHVS